MKMDIYARPDYSYGPQNLYRTSTWQLHFIGQIFTNITYSVSINTKAAETVAIISLHLTSFYINRLYKTLILITQLPAFTQRPP